MGERGNLLTLYFEKVILTIKQRVHVGGKDRRGGCCSVSWETVAWKLVVVTKVGRS